MKTLNIIFVVVDTLRADYLSCYGYPERLTPNIDLLSEKGTTFTNVYSASNFTAPAFASLFTSLYPASHGVYDFKIKKLPPSPLMDAAKRSGYTRKAVVDFGFFKSYLAESFDSMESLTDLTVNWSTEGPALEVGRSLEWIQKHHAEPFFLFLHISPPHTPYRFPKKHYEAMMENERTAGRLAKLRAHEILGALLPVAVGDRIPDDEIERFNRCAPKFNEISVDEEHVSIIKDLYRMEVEVVDEMLGLLMAGLKSLGILESTIVSFSSDHGEELWEHGSFSHGASAMYNEVVRTPWIVSRPSGTIGGRGVDVNVSHTNILPTLLDLAGIDLTDEIRSKSVRRLMDRMEDEADQSFEVETPPVYCETAHLISVISGDYKLIALNKRTRFRSTKEKLRYRASRVGKLLSGKGERPIELYNLRLDPGEKTNVASMETETVARLKKLIDIYYAGGRFTFGEGQDLTEAEEERIKRELEGLGYY